MSDPGVNDQADFGNEFNGNTSMISPGARLAAYRQERGWTIEQVAGQLNLAPRQVIAIESDDYPSLPGMPIVRGFIRAYAKLLKVDVAPLLATLGGETVLVHKPIAPDKSLSTPFSETRLPTMTGKSRLSSRWVIALLLVLLLAAIIWAVQHEAGFSTLTSSQQTKDSTAILSGSNAKPQEQPTATPEEPVALAKPETPAAGSAENAAVGPGDASTAVAPTPVIPAPADVTPAEAAKPSTPETTGKNTLSLTANEDSWVEIRRVGASTAAVARLVKAGETEIYEVTDSISLVIGNAHGVEVTLRGAPLELKAGKGNVARLKLK